MVENLKLGILGGGQLGRMMIQEGINWNIDFHTMDLDPESPCKDINHNFVLGDITDYQSVYEFGKGCDIVTIEIERVNTEALKALEKDGVTIYPQPDVLDIIKDKRLQKRFYQENAIPTADFVLVENQADIWNHSEFLPAVNKLAKDGYDGKGVSVLKGESDIPKSFDAPGLLEKWVDFEKEISVIVSRNKSGEVRCFPVVEMVFHPEQNLVEYLFSPAAIDREQEEKAQQIALNLAEKLGIVGNLAVEMFLTKAGEILVNEVAPRPHNSGHQTIEGNITSQFEQHLRAILNLPLGRTDADGFSAMINVLGEPGNFGLAKVEGLKEVLKKKGAYVHLYGKKETKPYRKMGHVTIVGDDSEEVKKTASFVKDTLKITA